ncbi:MAG TPA: tetratricopeptide repeat protein [Candidatus Binatia bacterium]|nr:tetratricopeptide repeat protein [Candidatus Binatia bacterium]
MPIATVTGLRRATSATVPALIALATVACFAGALGNGFVTWDDDRNLTENPAYRGLSPAQLRWMFTTFHMGLYQPLAWLTFGLDYTLWGMDPFGYHLTSVLLHGLGAAVFYLVGVRLLRRAGVGDGRGRLGAAVGALVFALHPLRVESVAWATERRDVLSGLFYLLSVLAYLRMHDAGGRARWRWYGTSVACFLAALLAKPLTMVLPAVLLVLDLYPLRRFTPGRRAALIWEKVPYVVLALAAGGVAMVAQQAAAAWRPSLTEHGVLARLAQAAWALCFYLWKMLVPLRLSPLYLLERPLDPTAPRYVAAMLTVAGVTAVLVLGRRRWPSVVAAAACYAISVSPVLGFVQNGPQIAADRYSYLASMPWAMVAGGVVGKLANGGRRTVVVCAAVVVLGLLALLTVRQTQVWRDSLALWERAVAVEPRNHIAVTNRGWARELLGDRAGAARDYSAAIAIDPRYELAWNDRGAVRQVEGDVEGAIADYDRAIALSPGYAAAYYNRGTAWQAKGETRRAAADYGEAIRLDPEDPRPFNNRGSIHLAAGDLERAVADFSRALGLDPGFYLAYVNRAGARERQGDGDGAVADYTRALELAPPAWRARPAIERKLAALRERGARGADAPSPVAR